MVLFPYTGAMVSRVLVSELHQGTGEGQSGVTGRCPPEPLSHHVEVAAANEEMGYWMPWV